MEASGSRERKGDGKGKTKHRSKGEAAAGATTAPQVHFISETKWTASVSIAETLSRLHVDVNGDFAIIRATRTSLQSFSNKGSAPVFLSDGTPFWEIKFKAPVRRPPRASSSKVMQTRDWLGALLSCNTSAEKRAAEEAIVCEVVGASSAAKYGPCRYGAACRERMDPSHCAKYSHPEGPPKCATDGCNRPLSGKYRTCCAQCKDSGGASHSSSCTEVAPEAILVVEDVTQEGETWVLFLRSLSAKAVTASSKLCKYGCGMRVCTDGDRVFDTCCRQCSSGYGRRGHDSGCVGPADPADLDDFQDSADLTALLPARAGLERTPSGKRVVHGASTEAAARGAPKECGICFDDDMDGAPVLCQFSHSFCRNCMGRHIKEELEVKGILPACPLSAECGHLLTREQVENIVGSGESADAILGRFDLLAQRLGLQAIGAFPCARATCQDWIVPSRPGVRQLVECPGCKIRFCSLCKRKPYHFRIPHCDRVPGIDQAWHEWLRNDRDAYLAKLAAIDPEYMLILEQLGSKKAEQARMLLEAEARRKEFAEMEDWKAKNCKCCPHCRRVINKVDGCDSMVCGRNYHGGDVQNGCGGTFNWSAAPAYVPQEAEHIPKVDLEDMGAGPEVHKMFWECEPGLYLRCAMCKFAIRGPLFLCIDCTACCACFRCANGMGSASGGHHLPDSHVFSILWDIKDLRPKDFDKLKEYRLTTRRRSVRPDEKLSPQELLMDLGFSAEVASKALEDFGGDADAAAASLLG